MRTGLMTALAVLAGLTPATEPARADDKAAPAARKIPPIDAEAAGVALETATFALG